MIKINEMIQAAKNEGYNETNAEAKVCQDIILTLISQSRLNRNVTIKGGVVMRSISNDARRATQDIDLDFIRYSLQDPSIRHFVEELNSIGLIQIQIIGDIEELKQQDYHGKRVNIKLIDVEQRSLQSKIDFGVHKHFNIQQEEFCFDVSLNENHVSLLINSKEQMLTEKLRSILKFGSFSTRYKDIFDIYYLSFLVDKTKLNSCLETLIYSDEGMKENNISDIIKRIKITFSNKTYQKNLSTSKKNWLGKNIDIVLNGIIDFIQSL